MVTNEKLAVIADLAKLLPDETTLARVNETAAFADKIAAADLSAADLTEEEILTPLREDIVQPSTPQSVILGAVTDDVNGYFIARGMEVIK